MEQRRASAGYYLAAAALVLLVLVAIGLIVGMAMRPAAEPASALVVTDQASVPCPAGVENATCYDTQITNNGGSTGTFVCGLDPSGDTQATFASGQGTERPTLGPNESIHVVTVVTTPGTDEPAPPRVLCTDTA